MPWPRFHLLLTIWDRKISPSASKWANNSEEIALLSVLGCDSEAPRNLSPARLRIPKIPDEMPSISFVDRRTERQLSSCDASIPTKDGISTLQHIKTNICDRTAWARHTWEFFSSCFGSRHTLHRTINGADVDHSTSINVAETFVYVSHWLSPSNKEF